jgi:phage gp36-like protein
MAERFNYGRYTDNVRVRFSRDTKQLLKSVADGEIHFSIPKDLF